MAEHSGIDLAVDNYPEWDCEAGREEAFDTTNRWLLDIREEKRGPMSTARQVF